LTAAVIGLALSFGRCGYKRITGLLQMAGWSVNAERVQRIWRADGLKVPAKQPKRDRLWLSDGSCIRLRPEHCNHVWVHDFVAKRTHDERPLKLLTVVDEYTRECLAILVTRRITGHEVLMTRSGLFLKYGLPEDIFTRQRVPASLSYAGGGCWTNIRNGPMNGVRPQLADRLLDCAKRHAADDHNRISIASRG
jgi:transposase InsO family protein